MFVTKRGTIHGAFCDCCWMGLNRLRRETTRISKRSRRETDFLKILLKKTANLFLLIALVGKNACNQSFEGSSSFQFRMLSEVHAQL